MITILGHDSMSSIPITRGNRGGLKCAIIPIIWEKERLLNV